MAFIINSSRKVLARGEAVLSPRMVRLKHQRLCPLELRRQ